MLDTSSDYNLSGNYSARKVADFVLDISTYLLASGAHCGRVDRNINRMTNVWGFDVHMFLTFKGVFVTVKDKTKADNIATQYRKTPEHNVHFDIISKISWLSWKIHDDKLDLHIATKIFEKIKNTPHYNFGVVALAIGCSCAGLCVLSGGDYKNALVAFIGAFCGYLVKLGFGYLKYNPMISTTVAAFTSTFITCLGAMMEWGSNPQAAIATAVLYLIPGVPLINSVIDLIEGYLTSSINRMLFSGFTLSCIAVGMTVCITLFGVSNFI